MSDYDKNKAWGFTLFGDDLRAEVGGKISLMGLYQSDMLFPSNVSFPINIAKFCLLIMYYEIQGAVTDDIIFKVSFGADQKSLMEVPILRKDMPDINAKIEASPADITTEDGERILHSRIPIILSPLTLVTEGRVRVRAHYSSGSILKMGSIAIRKIPIEDFNKISGAVPVENQKDN